MTVKTLVGTKFYKSRNTTNYWNWEPEQYSGWGTEDSSKKTSKDEPIINDLILGHFRQAKRSV